MPRSLPIPLSARGTKRRSTKRQRGPDPPTAVDSAALAPFELTVRRADGGSSRASPPVYGYGAGDVLAGKYQLVRSLGEGGMSSVWAAQNLVLDAQVALKLIRQDGSDAHAVERMLREARSAARLQHPAIVRMLDVGRTDQGDGFLVMELLAGISLRRRLRDEGPLTPVRAAQLLLPVADALAVAHSFGVVHRDLKPDNIVCVPAVSERCQPKIIDFGIAKQLGQQSPRITQQGTILGSPEYMSPEQVQGLLEVDHRTDIWSFCVVLYELVTGATPFSRSSGIPSVLDAILHHPPRPMGECGVDEPELWSILERGFQKSPHGRWSDMHALGAALAAWLLRRGIEEDVDLHSVRAMWLGGDPPPPLQAVQAPGRAAAERARATALAESYVVPKTSALGTALGLAAAIVATSLIGAAGLLAARAPDPAAPAAAPAASTRAPMPAKSALVLADLPAARAAPSAARAANDREARPRAPHAQPKKAPARPVANGASAPRMPRRPAAGPAEQRDVGPRDLKRSWQPSRREPRPR